MKAIILAGGMGNRLLHLTTNTPKCMLKVHGKPIIEHLLTALMDLGINDISIVKGYLKDQINYERTKSYYNQDYENSGILTSLFCAEQEFNDDVMIFYSDTIFNKSILEEIMNANGDICIAVDKDIKKSHKTPEDKENALINENKVQKIGRNLADGSNAEFIGIAKFTKKGAEILKNVYHEAITKHGDRPFQQSLSVKKAFLTDILQELIDRDYEVTPVLIKGKWTEIDTLEDLKEAGGEITSAKITPEVRRGLLKNILGERGFVRVIEAHSGISAIIANNAVTNGKTVFDALWISSLTESAAKGQPDIEIMGPDSRLATVHQVLEVTNKPVIIDGDTGGDPNALEYFLRKAESLGVSAVIIEDKVYPKRNSLDAESEQTQEDPKVFANKIKRGKSALLTDQFMLIARIESLIAGKSVDDAIERAKHYLEAGVDGIMIHSKSKTPDEILSFARDYKELCNEIGIKKPLVCVPTTYNEIKESELRNEGFNVIIHANHLLRASIKSMQNVCNIILENERSMEADKYCSSVKEIFDIVGFTDIKNKEKNLEVN